MARWRWGFIILAIIALLASCVGPWSATSHSAQMGTSIENALKANALEVVGVDMNGNVATLSGDLASQDLVDKAMNVAANTECETCKKKGKIWHVVENNINLKKPKPAPVTSPYVFSAEKAENGGVVLSGYVRNAAEKQRVNTEAEALFPGKVTDRLKIANGAPNAAWGDIISQYLPELARLDRGRYTLTDLKSNLTGFTRNASIRDRIDAVARANSLGYNETARITVPNPRAEAASACQTIFNELKGSAKINFASAKADIRGSESTALLDKLASAANDPKCSGFKIGVAGHTDSDGDAGYNQRLSQARADTVVAYLGRTGVDLSRLTSVGHGETRPIATNDTREGKAANRRIEFTITTSE